MAGELQPTDEGPTPDPPILVDRKSWMDRLRKITLIEWLVMAAIVGVVVALIWPAPKWARSGERPFPVEITIFNGQSLKPIIGARVTVVRALPATGESPPAAFGDTLSLETLKYSESCGISGADGVARFETLFRTGANHVRPETHAHLSRYWVLVAADGFSPVGFPLRTESVPTKEIREQGRISAMVALYSEPVSESP